MTHLIISTNEVVQHSSRLGKVDLCSKTNITVNGRRNSMEQFFMKIYNKQHLNDANLGYFFLFPYFVISSSFFWLRNFWSFSITNQINGFHLS